MAFDGTLKFDTAIDKSGFESGISDLGSIAKTGMTVVTGAVAGVTAAVGGAVAGVTALSGAMLDAANSAASYGDNIDKASQKIGMSAEAYQEWDFILQHAGTSIDSMTQGMKTLSNAVVDQSDAAVAAFDKLGISIEDAAAMSQEDLFGAVIAKLQEMPAGAERTALANDLLGRSSMELGALLNTSAEETEKMRQQVHDLGGVMSDEAVKDAAAYEDALLNLQTAGDGLKRGLASELLPSLTTMMDGMSSILAGDLSGADVLVSGLDSLTDNLEIVFENISSTAEKILPKLTKGIQKAMPDVIKAGGSIFTTLLTSALSMLPVVLTSLAGVGTELIGSIVTTLSDNSEEIISSGLLLLSTLAMALLSNSPLLLTAAMELIMQLVGALTDPDALTGLLDVVLTIITTLATLLGENLSPLLTAAITIIATLGAYLGEHSTELLTAVLTIITAILNAVLDNLDPLMDAAVAIITALADALTDPEKMGTLLKAVGELLAAFFEELLLPTRISENTEKFTTKLIDSLKEMITGKDWAALGKAVVDGIMSGFLGVDFDMYEYLDEFGNNWISGVKDIFGIQSPSRVMRDQVGKYLALGVGEGFTEEMPDVREDARRALGTIGADGIGVSVDADAVRALEISVDTDAVRALREMQGMLTPSSFVPAGAGSSVVNNYSYTTNNSTNSATPDGGGVRDIIIPVSIGGDVIDTVVVHAVQSANAASGGVTL